MIRYHVEGIEHICFTHQCCDSLLMVGLQVQWLVLYLRVHEDMS